MLQVFSDCGFCENPAKDILTRLTLLSLRSNQLATLPDALPAGSVHNLRLLDISFSKPLGVLLDSNVFWWHAENIATFQCGWASLQVLGIVPDRWSSVSLRATAQELQRLLQRQADAAQPQRLPATVVCNRNDHYELLSPARDLAEISE